MKTKHLLIPFALGLSLTLGLLWLLGGRPAPATAAPTAELHVCAAGPPTCDHATVQAAVDAANDDDVIKVATGAYTDTITRTAPSGYPPVGGVIITQVVYISKSVTIRGGYTTTDWNTSNPVANPTTLDAESGKRVVFIGGDSITVTLENLRITGGDAAGLGGDPSLAAAGGGVYVISATVTLSGNVIYSNTVGLLSGSGGGVALAESDGATLSGNTIYSNTARLGGGVAMGQSDNATLSGNAIHTNVAYDGGGVALGQSDNATLSNNAIYSNTVAHDGGGVALGQSDDATLSGNDIYSNAAGLDGGGVEVYISARTMLSGNAIHGNRASHDGGGVELDTSGFATLSGNDIYSNTTGNDGGGVKVIHNPVTTLSGNAIYGNRAGNYGGGVSLYESDDAALSSNDIYSNTADMGGGVNVQDSDDATLNGNAIYSNTADNGGGVEVCFSARATLNSNTICNNVAALYGGGVQLAYSDDAMLDNNVIADNQVGVAGSGMYVSASTADLRHNTIARNTGGDGSGVCVINAVADYSTVALTNTILVSHSVGISVTAGNTATLESTLWGSGVWANDDDWGGAGTIITGTHNWWGDPAFVDPDAGDYHIGTGSAAIDEGVDAGVATDKDGVIRPQGTDPDLGAYELEQFTLAVTKAGTGDGTVTSDPAGINCGADCTETYGKGTVVTLTATPDVDSVFAGWSGHADCADGKVTMDADKTCTATFALPVGGVTVPVGTPALLWPWILLAVAVITAASGAALLKRRRA